MFLYFWERARTQAGEGQRQSERETQNLKQAPNSELSAQLSTELTEPPQEPPGGGLEATIWVCPLRQRIWSYQYKISYRGLEFTLQGRVPLLIVEAKSPGTEGWECAVLKNSPEIRGKLLAPTSRGFTLWESLVYTIGCWGLFKKKYKILLHILHKSYLLFSVWQTHTHTHTHIHTHDPTVGSLPGSWKGSSK